METFQLEEISEVDIIGSRTLPGQLADALGLRSKSYAILSHTWDDEKVTFDDMRSNIRSTRRKKGFSKIKGCCEQAKKDGFSYVWIDCCCIDKKSSAELTESINSMFKWYQWADTCYVFLSDVENDGYNQTLDVDDQFSKSNWFNRGWTLQELLAPPMLKFFSKDWRSLGPSIIRGSKYVDVGDYGGRNEAEILFLTKLVRITNIPYEALAGQSFIDQYSVAQRMSWASERQTTRPEDIAYSLMGIFRVSMPVLYGEGRLRAFRRLQHEIIKMTLDQSIFCWMAATRTKFTGILAESPTQFKSSFDVEQDTKSRNALFSMTNWGLQIRGLQVFRVEDDLYFDQKYDELYFAILGCTTNTKSKDGTIPLIGIYLIRVMDSLTDMDCGLWRRVYPDCDRTEPSVLEDRFLNGKEMFILETEQLIERELKSNGFTRGDADWFDTRRQYF